MSRNSALVFILLLGGVLAPASSYAQLTPPAGSAGAGNSPINGIPSGPANPSALSDPSGIGNASKIPPLGTNTPVASPPAYKPIGSQPSRVATPSVGGSQRISSPRPISSRPISSQRPRFRRHDRPQTSKFTGICRGC